MWTKKFDIFTSEFFTLELLDIFTYKFKIFKDSSHPLLNMFPLKNKFIIEIVSAKGKNINENVHILFSVLCKAITCYKDKLYYDDQVKSKPLTKDELIKYIIFIKKEIYLFVYIYMESIRDNNLTDVNLYLQLSKILSRINKNIDKNPKYEIIELIMKKYPSLSI